MQKIKTQYVILNVSEIWRKYEQKEHKNIFNRTNNVNNCNITNKHNKDTKFCSSDVHFIYTQGYNVPLVEEQDV